MERIRVLVVEDSRTVRRRLCEVLASDSQLELIGEAADGKRAIELCREYRPDVVTMDMMLPVLSGLAATEYIMAHCPTPILVVSASINRGELFKTYEALAAGAVDVLSKPNGKETDDKWEQKFIDTVKLVSRIRVITHPRARLASLEHQASRHLAPAREDERTPRRYQIAAVGASTGGPGAIVEILRSLPPDFSLPLLFVLHINEPFGISFVEWLDGQTRHRVAYAQDGDLVASAAGRVVMAPPGSHLVVHAGRVHLTRDPERHSCRPSVDTLFESVALEYGAAAIGCLLTGMGQDGASGLLDIRRAGGFTIAQDETTSVVYGMPQAAVRLGAAARVLPLGEIAAALTSLGARGLEVGP
jgi:two-component system, chemotaxis family, protein-glutamate methylesterase/glutaminase